MRVDANLIFKVLSNPMRVQILAWLKEPESHFTEMIHLPECERGKGYVCVGAIQEKVGITQSTVSSYLDQMKRAGLLSSKRIGQWTYYRREEAQIKQFVSYLSGSL